MAWMVAALIAMLGWSQAALAQQCHPYPACEGGGNLSPSVTLTSPANGASSPAPGSFTVSATASDSDGAISAVEFISNNVSIGVDSTAPYSISYGGLAVGSYSIKARATDDEGATKLSAAVTVTVTVPTNPAPTVSLTSPANGATATAPATFNITANAADSNGTISSVQFKSGGTVVFTDTSYPYSYSYSGVATGSYALSAVATDNGGATATSATANVTVTTPTSPPPTITLVSPTNGSTAVALDSFVLSATAADSDGSISNVKFYVNGGLVYTDAVAPYWYSYPTGTAGSFAVNAVATDNAGGSTTSATATISVQTPPNVSLTRTYVYDSSERLCKTINPESGATVVGYDDADNIAWTAEGSTLTGNTCDRDSVPVAQRTLRTYDAMNRLTAVSTPGGTADVVTSYFADGLVNSVTAANPGGANVTTSYSYNKRRMLVQETSSQPGWYSWGVGYGYNANGHMSTLTYPTGTQVSYAPNALGQATQVGTYASGISYYPNGAIAQFTYGNGVVHTMTQNARGLPARSQDRNGSTAILDDSYAFDANGNVTDITDQAQAGATTRGMVYDGLDRLTAAVAPGQWDIAAYTYDGLDNLRTATLGIAGYTYGYNAKNQLATLTRSGGSTYTYTTDARGNITNDGRQSYVFDPANRLNDVTNKESYRYDGLGRRVLSWRPNAPLSVFMYSQAGQVLYVEDGIKAQSTVNIYLGNTLLATRSTAHATGALTERYQHTDSLGSPVAVTDTNRAVVERTSYAPYGAPFNHPVEGVGYTGHMMDQQTGLIYMQQRYYDPQVGRFLSNDPVSTNANTGAGFNRYAYANNNPLRFTDPDGRNAVTGIGGFLYESAQFVQGNGFDSASVGGAFADGYNGEGGGFADAAYDDATTLIPLGAVAGIAIKVVRLAKAAKSSGTATKLLASPRRHLLDSVSDSKLASKIDKMYRPNAKIGNGSTADAIRHELKTGEMLSPKGHMQKGKEMASELLKDMRSNRLSESDEKIARELLKDLKNAMSGK